MRPARSRPGGGTDTPLPFTLAPARRGGLTVLCLGAHADDIEIVCGGTILAMLAARRDIDCHWVVFSGGASPRDGEARKGGDLFLAHARRRQVVVHGFRDGFFPFGGSEIKDAFEALAREVSPDLIFTHARDDRHQDHRLVSDLTWQTFRRHLILEYEVPKYDGDLGVPNVFVPLTAPVARAKIRGLLSTYRSQRRKRWFTSDTFHGILRLRGLESGAQDGLAEAFYARKAVLAW